MNTIKEFLLLLITMPIWLTDLIYVSIMGFLFKLEDEEDNDEM